MPLDPDIANVLALIESMGGGGLSASTPEEARAAFRMMTVDARDPATVAQVASVEDVTVPGPSGDMAGRIYRPDATGPDATGTVPTIVFYHGGGWVIGDIESHDDQARILCRDVGAVVLSVEYRLAPETKFPGPVEDSFAGLRWAFDHIADLGGDPARIAVAGDSAGGNLAAVVAQLARADGPPIAAQLLLYPAVDAPGEYPSRKENAEGYLLTEADMLWFGGHYVEGEDDLHDPRMSPLRHPDLTGLPPAVIVTAEFDPLRDEGEAYAAALRDAGVPVVLRRFDGLIHGFFGLGPLSAAAAAAVTETTAALRELLAPSAG